MKTIDDFELDGVAAGFFAFEAAFTGGVWVASGDTNGDGSRVFNDSGTVDRKAADASEPQGIIAILIG